MRAIKPKIECLFVALIVLMLAGSGVSAANARLNVSVITRQDMTGATNMEVATPDLGPAQLRTLPSGGAVVQLGKLPQGGEPGDPMLPYSLVRLLVPPDADLTTVKAELSSGTWEELPGEYEIAPAPPAAHTAGDRPVISWGTKDKSIIINGRDSTIYGKNAYFPTEAVQIVSVGQFRQWKLVEFKVWMAAYNPVKKTVRILRNTIITPSIQRLPANLAVGLSSSNPPVLPGAAEFASELLLEVDNPQDLETFYGGLEGAPGLVQADYVIITTNTIIANSTELASFVLDKQAQGYTVKTVTEAAVADDTHYVSGASCDARADNIRSWLQNHYLGDGTEYVLLIGNPHPDTFISTTSIPMKWTWPRSTKTSDRSAPSDMYFAELSNTWNLDGDSMYGEFNGDYGAGGADKNCELKVGRIPVYDSNYVNLDAILQKCIDYDTASTGLGYRSKVLIPAAVSNFGPQDNNGDGDASDPVDYPNSSYRTFGADWGQAVKSLATSVSFSPYTLYEKSGVYADGSAYPLTACNANLNNANFINEWQNQYGFVTWWAHGSSTSASRFTWTSDGSYANICGNQPPHLETTWTTLISDTDCASLDDTTPSFVVQASCYNGLPENSSNLGYSLLKRGAIGTISGTRVTWYSTGSWNTGLGATYGDNASYGYYMFDEMGVNNNDVGTALVNCKASFGTGWASGASWMNMVGFSLYGDPSLSLSICPGYNHKMHYPQLPDPNGWDVAFFIDWLMAPFELADDWECSETGPVSDIHFWISYNDDDVYPLQAVKVRIYSNNPQGPSDWSEPNELLWEREFQAGQFTELLYGTGLQGWFEPFLEDFEEDNHQQYFQVNITDINDPFIQQEGEIYWLSLEVVSEFFHEGWKTSLDHFMDDAVWRVASPNEPWTELRDPITEESLDFSFVITGEEEEGPAKWQQRPDLTPNGIDVDATYPSGMSPWHRQLLADDFLCTSTGPITDINIWGSWYHDELPSGGPSDVRFTLRIHADIPADDPENEYGYSVPGEMLWGRNFYPGDFNVAVEASDISEGYYVPYDPCDACEPYYEPDADWTCWRYDFHMDPYEGEAFVQQGNPYDPVIYWLLVQARPYDYNAPRFGWKTSWEHWNDDAVFSESSAYGPWQELRYPNGHPYEGESIDLAFAIKTPPIPELKPAVPHLKWSQPPVEIGPLYAAPLYCGWDEESHNMVDPPTTSMKIVADDFRCLGTMPVTSIHWWGSHVSWEGPDEPPEVPEFWRIAFWSNVPAGVNAPYSYPEKLLWQIDIPAERVDVNMIGSDYFPSVPFSDTCFQYNVELEREEIFWQNEFIDDTNGNIFWISIAAEYNDVEPNYPWGWKTRPWSWMDDAVTFVVNEPNENTVLDPISITPLEYQGESYDVCFELDTDPNWIKWEQAYDSIRHWPHYEDEESMTITDTWILENSFQVPGILTLTGLTFDDSNGTLFGVTATGTPDILYEFTTDGSLIDSHSLGFLPGVGGSGALTYNSNTGNLFLVDDQIYEITTSGVLVGSFAGPNLNMAGMAYDSSADTLFVYSAYSNIIYEVDPNDGSVLNSFGAPGSMVRALGFDGTNLLAYEIAQQRVYLLDPANGAVRRFFNAAFSGWLGGGLTCDGTTIYTSDESDTVKAYAPGSYQRLVADDWPCDSNGAVSAIVWWGSYIGYDYEACQGPVTNMPVKPNYFLLNIWTDVPAGADPCYIYSHPGEVIWEYMAYDYDEVLVGYDKHPEGEPTEPVFRYSVRVPDEEQFQQDTAEGVYWLSVVAVYDNNNDPTYHWGWTNHEHMFNDDAVAGTLGAGDEWTWVELYDQNGVSEDMSFVLFTECMNPSNPDDPNWTYWGKPHCWCYARQCRGDADGIMQGPFPVASFDLTAFRLAFNVHFSLLDNTLICSDYNHTWQGPFPVASFDLGILRTYLNKHFTLVPECGNPPDQNYIFWTN